jgi:hypothetical protein
MKKKKNKGKVKEKKNKGKAKEKKNKEKQFRSEQMFLCSKKTHHFNRNEAAFQS